MQKILVGICLKNFTFSILSSLKLNFSATFFGTTLFCTILFRADTGNIRKIVNFTYTLKINNYKLPVFRTNFLKLKFWKFISNSYCPKQLLTFNLENVSLLTNPNINPKNGVAYKKCLCPK